jgi:hypothetical protein
MQINPSYYVVITGSEVDRGNCYQSGMTRAAILRASMPSKQPAFSFKIKRDLTLAVNASKNAWLREVPSRFRVSFFR